MRSKLLVSEASLLSCKCLAIELQLKRVLNAGSVSLLSLCPVDDLPDPFDITSLVVQVLKQRQKKHNKILEVAIQTHLKVVCMLPHINTKNGNIRAIDGILVLGSLDLETTLGSTLANQPSPSGTLETKQLSAERLDKGLVRSPAGDNGFAEYGCSGNIIAWRSRWSEVLPEQGVINVTTTVETELLLEGNQGWDIV